jgi:hypothetical protein
VNKQEALYEAEKLCGELGSGWEPVVKAVIGCHNYPVAVKGNFSVMKDDQSDVFGDHYEAHYRDTDVHGYGHDSHIDALEDMEVTMGDRIDELQDELDYLKAAKAELALLLKEQKQ